MRKLTLTITILAAIGCVGEDPGGLGEGQEDTGDTGDELAIQDGWNMCQSESGELSKPGFDVFDRPFCTSGHLVWCWTHAWFGGTVCEDDYDPLLEALDVAQAGESAVSGWGGEAGMCCDHRGITVAGNSLQGKCWGTDDHNACANWLACPPGESFNMDGYCIAGDDAVGNCCGSPSDKPEAALDVKVDPISGTVCEDDYEPLDVGLTVSQASGLGSAGMCCRLYIKPTMTDGSGGGPGVKCYGTDDHNACATWLACPPGETFNTDGGCNANGDAVGSCCGGASDKPEDDLDVAA